MHITHTSTPSLNFSLWSVVGTINFVSVWLGEKLYSCYVTLKLDVAL